MKSCHMEISTYMQQNILEITHCGINGTIWSYNIKMSYSIKLTNAGVIQKVQTIQNWYDITDIIQSDLFY